MDKLNMPLAKIGPLAVTPLLIMGVLAVWYFLLRKK